MRGKKFKVAELREAERERARREVLHLKEEEIKITPNGWAVLPDGTETFITDRDTKIKLQKGREFDTVLEWDRRTGRYAVLLKHRETGLSVPILEGEAERFPVRKILPAKG